MKKLCSWIAAVVLTISMLPGITPVSHAASLADLSYTVNNGEVTITGCNETASGALEIPAEIEGCPVTAVGNLAFSNCSGLTSITLPDSITAIKDGAFNLCVNLKTVTLPNRLQQIGVNAFGECSSLQSIQIPDTVTQIGTMAFTECTNLKSVRFSKSVTETGYGLFWDCTALERIEFPEGVTEIAPVAFLGCPNIKSIYLPKSLITVNFGAFRELNSSAVVRYAGSETDREKISVLEDNEPLLNVSWHYNCCFESDEHLYDHECDETCNLCGSIRVAEHTFRTPCQPHCDHCPYPQPNPAEHTYDPCSNLCAVCDDGWRDLTREDHSFSSDCDNTCNLCGAGYYATAEHVYDTICDPDCNKCGEIREVDGHVYYNDCDMICHRCYSHREAPHNLAEPCSNLCIDCGIFVVSSTPHTYESACDPFCNVCNEASLDFSHTYDNDQDPACNVCNCTNEKFFTFELYNGLEYNHFGRAEIVAISDSAPNDIRIPSHVFKDGVLYETDRIDYCAFENCTWLQSVFLPDSISYIGPYAFAQCSNLQNIHFPASMTYIGANAFWNCSNLQNINLPEGITEIDSGVFSGCSSLQNISLPESIIEIGFHAFSGCSGLQSITLPDTVTTIGDYAFAGCSGLTTLNIPANVSSIGNDAEDSVGIMVFSECSNLTELTVDPENHWFSAADRILYNKEKTEIVLTLDTVSGNVTLPETLDSIKEYTFRDRLGLTGITIPNSVQTIGEYAFSGCENLNLVDLGEGVELIEEFAFSSTGISTIEIPNSVTTLGLSSFGSNYYLKSVSIPSRVSVMDSPFSSCYFLESIEVAEDNPYFTAHNGAVYNKEQTELLFCAQGYTGNIIIPDTVTSIPSFYYCDCSGIVLPNGITAITGDRSFECRYMEFIYLPKSITYIDEAAFVYSNPDNITIYYEGSEEDRANIDIAWLPTGWEKIEKFNWQYNCTSFGGDIDQDQIITTADVAALMRRLNTSSDYIGNADINNDGKIPLPMLLLC